MIIYQIEVAIKMFEKVKEVLERDISPFLAMEGGNIELVNFVEATLKGKIPEVTGVVAV